MKKFGFTLAEVLITLAIIGVVAALTIPSVVANTQQQEFKTGLRKAVSVLNSAITMNMAIDGETPYDNKDLFNYLQRHMSIMSSTQNLNGRYFTPTLAGHGNYFNNAAFYTTDGMRFEFANTGPEDNHQAKRYLYENPDITVCTGSTTPYGAFRGKRCDGCGSYGLNNNYNNTTKPPCLIMVDVNGDRKPTPSNINCTFDKRTLCPNDNKYKASDPKGKKLRDIFSIMITESSAIPYGVAAQKAMYEAQK